MTSRSALLTATLLAASAPTVALARPTIIVDEAIPFSADDLANAVSIRADSNASIRVTRQGDLVVITVGDHRRSIDVIGLDDPHDLARIVALVIVALDAPSGSPTAPVDPISPPLPPTPPTPPPPPIAAPGTPLADVGTPPAAVLFGGGRTPPPPRDLTLRGSVGMEQAGYGLNAVAMVSISRRLGPSAHLTTAVGYDRQYVFDNDGSSMIRGALPVRLGLELRYRWFAIEGGFAGKYYADPSCGDNVFSKGAYGAARAYLFPIVAIQHRVFIEGGMRHTEHEGCALGSDDMPLQVRDTAAHLSFGVEVPL